MISIDYESMEILYLRSNFYDSIIFKFIGQTATEDMRRAIDVTSSDDRILNYCLQKKNEKQSEKMRIVLVTNDKNLSSKAILNGIGAVTSREFQKRF